MQVLLEKLAAVARLKAEIEALRLVAPLLAEAKDIPPQNVFKKFTTKEITL